MANNLLALNGNILYFLRKAYVRLTLQADKGGRIAVKRLSILSFHFCSFPLPVDICSVPFLAYVVFTWEKVAPFRTITSFLSWFNLIFLYPSIVRTFAQHKDDRRKVEKALESSGLPSGKVRPFLLLPAGFWKKLCVEFCVYVVWICVDFSLLPHLSAYRMVLNKCT